VFSKKVAPQPEATMACSIRLATLDDAEQVREIYAPFCEATPVSFETEAPTVFEMRRRIEKTLAFYPWLVGDDGGQVLGYAYASAHRERAAYRWSVDVSVYVREGRRRSGLGRALYTSLFEILRLQRFTTALAGTTLPNPGSVGLHNAMGFGPVGVYRAIGFKCGEWHDVAWWQLPLREIDGAPPEPIALAGVQALPEWNEAIRVGQALLR
jgi:L-amino acid N-acyltransferase YncA